MGSLATALSCTFPFVGPLPPRVQVSFLCFMPFAVRSRLAVAN